MGFLSSTMDVHKNIQTIQKYTKMHENVQKILKNVQFSSKFFNFYLKMTEKRKKGRPPKYSKITFSKKVDEYVELRTKGNVKGLGK